MYSIVREITDLSIRAGVRFHFDSMIQRVNRNAEGNQVSGIRLNGKDYPYDAVISDLDVNTFYRSGLLECTPPKWGRRQALSTSATIFYWGVTGTHENLDLHNVLFTENYREEFRHLFKLKKMYSDPTVYIYISSKRAPGDDLPGHENWFVMVNAPASNGEGRDSEIAATRSAVLKKINAALGIDLSTKKKGLYFTGGSVHPGGGIPLCLASAKIVADLIDQ